MKRKIYALVDCNSFYCSCERLFRPDLKNRPVGVLSNNDGCFISRTNELKALGVKMGAPYFQVKDLCEKNNVAVFSSNFALYTNISDRVMNTLAKFTPHLEVYSVDEAFMDLTFIASKDLDSYAREIKACVEREVGIPVSIGVSFSKTLAKVANHLGKKSEKAKGVVVLTEDKLLDIALERTPIGDVWGIGRARTEQLKAMGITSAKKLRDFKNDRVIQKQFTKVGLMTKEELAGEDRFTLDFLYQKKKEIMCSRTFADSIVDMDDMKQAIANYITDACEKLREQNSTCAKLEVFARTSPYKNTPQDYAFAEVKLLSGTQDTLRLIQVGMKAVEKMFKPGFEYKKAGVRLCHIVDERESQLSLFEPGDDTRSSQLMRVVDLINRREGDGTVKSMACGVTNIAFRMNRNFKSPRYVTGYSELRKVN
ncbi:MAG: hypothetical protein CME62_07160 [Halobacteriovoraceae bacterium]|nr:hypothetical protein [Halobacteriovoraceae bacterium]|tara:strand:+ start:7876 stop:9150 length:1275 start_codon:yes stop_codon:yes gene_type:complete